MEMYHFYMYFVFLWVALWKRFTFSSQMKSKVILINLFIQLINFIEVLSRGYIYMYLSSKFKTHCPMRSKSPFPTTTSSQLYMWRTYLCPLNVFKHSHVALLHIQNVPSSLALNKCELLKNCRQVKDPVTAEKLIVIHRLQNIQIYRYCTSG